MIRTCGEDQNVGALLLTGAGTAFCAGGNVKGMGAHRDKAKLEMSFDDRVADLQERQRLLTGALVSVRKPTIAALPGPAVGAGLALAMACDIRIAAQSAFVSTGYARVAPERRLRHRLAPDAAGRHVAGTRIDVHRRQGRCGQMRDDRSRQPRGARRQAADRGVRTGQSRSQKARRLAMRYMKDNLDEALQFDFETARDHEAGRDWSDLTTTADHKEAVQAFIDKRKPVFTRK